MKHDQKTSRLAIAAELFKYSCYGWLSLTGFQSISWITHKFFGLSEVAATGATLAVIISIGIRARRKTTSHYADFFDNKFDQMEERLDRKLSSLADDLRRR